MGLVIDILPLKVKSVLISERLNLYLPFPLRMTLLIALILEVNLMRFKQQLIFKGSLAEATVIF